MPYPNPTLSEAPKPRTTRTSYGQPEYLQRATVGALVNFMTGGGTLGTWTLIDVKEEVNTTVLRFGIGGSAPPVMIAYIALSIDENEDGAI